MWSSGPQEWGGSQEPEKSTNRHQMCNNLTRSVLGPWGGLLRPPGEASWVAWKRKNTWFQLANTMLDTPLCGLDT